MVRTYLVISKLIYQSITLNIYVFQRCILWLCQMRRLRVERRPWRTIFSITWRYLWFWWIQNLKIKKKGSLRSYNSTFLHFLIGKEIKMKKSNLPGIWKVKSVSHISRFLGQFSFFKVNYWHLVNHYHMPMNWFI